jgi:2,4-diaminopentanoate dehydrogenase
VLRVVNVGTGLVGQEALRAIIDHPDTELVGHVVHAPEKAGRDVGELIGRAPTGVISTTDLDAALAAGPDVVSYFATTHGRLKATVNDFCSILASGIDIVTTSIGALINPGAARPDVLERLNAACAQGGSTLFATGIDPGFFSDYLPVVLSGCARRIDAVRIYEMAIYESGGQSDLVAFEQVGFGLPIETITPLVHPEGLKASWGGVLMMIAEQLGVTVDEIVTSHEMLPSPETFAYQGRTIERGTIAGMRFEIAAMAGGRNVISVAHVTRARRDLAPDWPRPHGEDAYRIVIEGDPRLECEVEFTNAEGDNLAGGFGITAMRAINAIPAVAAAPPGVRSVFDLPLITGRGRVAGPDSTHQTGGAR